MSNLREKGLVPASSDSSPIPLQGPRPPKRTSGCLRKPNALPPPTQPPPGHIRFDEEECKEEEVVPGVGAETQGNIYCNNSHIAENIPATIEARAYAVQDQQENVREPGYIIVYQPPPAAEESRKWYERPVSRGCMAISCFLALLLVVGIVALVVYLPKPAGVASPATPEPTTEAPATPEPTTKSPTPEATTAPPPSEAALQIACNFLSISNVTKCRSTVKFDSSNVFDTLEGSTVPTEIGLLTQLTFLNIANLPGTNSTVPSEIGLLTGLTALEFGFGTYDIDRKFGYFGTIPSSISNLKNLTWLSFERNEFSGTLPPSLSALTELQYMSFGLNQLTGSIPSSYSSLTNLISLDFSNNGLADSIPSSISSLNQLTALLFYANYLTGHIPSSMSSLKQLVYLDFWHNALTGSIPASLSSLTALGELYFNNNTLTGSIPSSFSSLTQIQQLRFDHNALAGSIPSSMCSFPYLQYIKIDCDEIQCDCCENQDTTNFCA